MKLTPFNVNDYVRVKLTKRGLEILQKHRAELWERLDKRPDWAMGVTVGADGYYRAQLWSVMQDLGPHICMGAESPFETEILIEFSGNHQER